MAKKETLPSLFEIMRVLSAEQRQRLGAVRRKMQSKPGLKEKLEKTESGWAIGYWKGKKKTAEARLESQKLEFSEL